MKYIKFTKRELDIIKLISNGHSTKSIASVLFLSEHTIETHRKNILKKSGLKNMISVIMSSTDII